MKRILHKNFSTSELMDKQLKTITIIFSIVALFLIGVGIILGIFSSKSVDKIIEAREELTSYKENLNEKVDEKFSEMENKTQKLQQSVEEKVDKKINRV